MVHRKNELINIKRGNSCGGSGEVCEERVSEPEADRDCFRGPEPAGFQIRRESSFLGLGRTFCSQEDKMKANKAPERQSQPPKLRMWL